MKEIAKGYFKSHPSVNEFFFTSDEQAFFSEQAAKNHAESLPKDAREVTKVTRAQAEGNVDKAAAEIEKAIEKAIAKVTDAKEKLEQVKGKADAETNETKKQKLDVAVGTATKALEDAEAELAKISG